jgi:uncharacterized protein (DUF3084 family)
MTSVIQPSRPGDEHILRHLQFVNQVREMRLVPAFCRDNISLY